MYGPGFGPSLPPQTQAQAPHPHGYYRPPNAAHAAALPQLATAHRAVAASAAAAAAYGYQPHAGSVAARVTPREAGMSAVEETYAQLADRTKARLGVPALGGGMASLGKAFIDHSGPHMLSAAQTGIKHTSPAHVLGDGSHDDIRTYMGAEAAAKLDAALSLSGTPASFGLDDTQFRAYHQASMAQALALEGATNPDLDMLLSATAPFSASQNMIRRAMAAQAQLRPINMTPSRWLWSGPAWRESVPVPTMSMYGSPPGGITPAMEAHMLEITCGADQGPMLMEPY